MRITSKDDAVFDVTYKLINNKAKSNAFIQGISGIAGFPSTLAVDCVVLLTHYEPMINEIRMLYGRHKITASDIPAVFGSLIKEILIDLAVDKFIGNIPVAGIYFNAISAKALTWRLGMLTAVVSSRGEDFKKANLSEVIKLIRNVTPQTNILKFTKPDYETFKKIVISVSDNEAAVFNNKIQIALKAFE